MPRSKRRGGAQRPPAPADTGGPTPDSADFPPDVRAESERRAEALIQMTAMGGSAVALFPDLHRAAAELSQLQAGHRMVRALPDDGPGRLGAAVRLRAEMERRGVDCGAVAVAEFGPQGLGLRAARPLEAHEVLLEIPRDLIMSTEDAFASPIGEFLRADPVCAGMPSMALAVFLLHEAARGPDSPWAAYIAALPAAFSNCLYFSPADLRLLKGSAVQERAAADFRRIVRQYAFFLLQMSRGRVSDALPFRARFAFDDFRWAVAAVMSRNNPVPAASGLGCALGLIPLWDLGNHKFGEMTTDFDTERRLLRFHAMEGAEEGQQVFFHYGNRPNSELLLYAGFAVPDNPHDRLPLRLGVSGKDPLCSERLRLLGLLGLEGSETFQLGRAEPLPEPLVAFVRLFVMREEELAHLAAACPDVSRLGAAVLQPRLGGAACEGPVDMAEVDGRAAAFLRTRLGLLLAGLQRGESQPEDGETAAAPFIHLAVGSEAALLRAALAAVEERPAPSPATSPRPCAVEE